MNHAIENTYRVFAIHRHIGNCHAMLTAADILRILDERGVKRGDLAKVLGVSQPNATRLYAPDPRSKTQNPRTLTYDEGCKLIEHYRLENDQADNEPVYLNVELLGPIVAEIVRLVRAQRGEIPVRPLALALSRYLQQLEERPAIRSSQDALEAVAQTSVPPLH